MADRRVRRALLIGAGAAAAALITLVAAVMLVPAERVGAWAAARASVALQREVSVESFGVRFLPRPAIALTGVSIAGAAPDDAALAGVQRVELRPRLLPLLKRQVVIDQIVFDRPHLLIVIAADSTSNLPSLSNTGDDGAAGSAELSIRRLQIRDGQITYRDATTASDVRLTGIRQDMTLSGSITAGELARVAITGDLSIDDIDLDLPHQLAWPVRDVRLRILHSADLDRAADRLDLTRLTLTLQDLTLDVDGSITALSDSARRGIDLHARTGNVDIAHFVASLPGAITGGSNGESLTGAAGTAQLDMTVRGRAGAGAVPDVDGVLQLQDGAIARGRFGTVASALNGRIAFSLDSVVSDGVTGRLLGEPLHVSFNVHDFSAPHGRVVLQTALAMAEAQKLGLLPDGSAGSGRVGVDIAAVGAFDTPAELALNGSIDLTGIQLQVAAVEKPVIVENGRISLDGRSAATTDLRAAIGGSDVALDFDAMEWLPYALGDSLRPPTVTFAARAALFDADEIFGVSADEHTYGELFFARLADRSIGGMTAAEAAAAMGLGMPTVPNIIMDGRIQADRFVRGAAPLDDVDVTIAARAGAVEVRAASFRMMGGGVHLSGRLGLAARPAAAGAAAAGAAVPDATGGSSGATAMSAAGAVGAASPPTQPLILEYAVSDVATGTFLERFTAFRDHITGDMLLAGTLSMSLDEHLLPVRESVMGGGTLAVQNGELVNWPLLRRLGERIGIAAFDTLAFRDWTGNFRFAGPRIVIEESMLEAGSLAVRAAGSFDVSGVLDIGATLLLPQESAARVPGAPAAFLVSAAAGADGRVPVGARFSGTARDPSIRLDLSEAGARVADAAREAAQDQAREMADRIADDLADRAAAQLGGVLPPRDSLATTADSARKKVEDEVVNRLRRLLPGRGGGGGGV
jgi:hypothetical protein